MTWNMTFYGTYGKSAVRYEIQTAGPSRHDDDHVVAAVGTHAEIAVTALPDERERGMFEDQPVQPL